MTYREKISELHKQALADQAEFLKVIEEIRKLNLSGTPVDEETLFRREKIYQQFNKALKEHRRLINYAESNQIPLDTEYAEQPI